jgi:hypothetical protein
VDMPAGRNGAVFCTNCGQKLTPEDRFCPECGTPRPSPPAQKHAPATTPVAEPTQFASALSATPSPIPLAGPGQISPPQSGGQPVFQQHFNVATPAPTIVFNTQRHGPNFFVRLLWWFFIGWWLSLIALTVAYGILLVSLGLLFPITFAILNRIPKIMTLRERSISQQVTYTNGVTTLTESNPTQRPWYVRVPYFVLIGSWLTLIWVVLAWIIAWGIITMPISLLMLDRVPAVATLQKN